MPPIQLRHRRTHAHHGSRRDPGAQDQGLPLILTCYLTPGASQAMLTYMPHRSVNPELNNWLDRHGYRHSHARRQETPHPYAGSPRKAHASMDQEPIGFCVLVRSGAPDEDEDEDEDDYEIVDEWRASPDEDEDEENYDHAPRRAAHARMIHQEPTGRAVFAAHERDHHITTAGRRALKRSQYALPPGPEEKRRGIKGRLPIDTIERARSALARASMMVHQGHITLKQLASARHAVHRAWPSIHVT